MPMGDRLACNCQPKHEQSIHDTSTWIRRVSGEHEFFLFHTKEERERTEITRIRKDPEDFFTRSGIASDAIA
jgi:hypothetical protein